MLLLNTILIYREILKLNEIMSFSNILCTIVTIYNVLLCNSQVECGYKDCGSTSYTKPLCCLQSNTWNTPLLLVTKDLSRRLAQLMPRAIESALVHLTRTLQREAELAATFSGKHGSGVV